MYNGCRRRNKNTFFSLVEQHRGRRRKHQKTWHARRAPEKKINTLLQNKINKQLITASKGDVTSKLHWTASTPITSCWRHLYNRIYTRLGQRHTSYILKKLYVNAKETRMILIWQTIVVKTMLWPTTFNYIN